MRLWSDYLAGLLDTGIMLAVYGNNRNLHICFAESDVEPQKGLVDTFLLVKVL